jgi:hypothetical protein
VKAAPQISAAAAGDVRNFGAAVNAVATQSYTRRAKIEIRRAGPPANPIGATDIRAM